MNQPTNQPIILPMVLFDHNHWRSIFEGPQASATDSVAVAIEQPCPQRVHEEHEDPAKETRICSGSPWALAANVTHNVF